MSAAARTPTVGYVNEDVGSRIQARRAQIGMSKQALAERAGIDRGTLSAIEAGGPARDTTLAAIDRALRDLEIELGLERAVVESTEVGLVEFDVTVEPTGAVHVVANGPITNRAEMEESIARIVRAIRQDAADSSDPSDS